MKRVVSIVLAVAMLVGMLPTTVWAAGDTLSNGCCEHHQTHDNSCGYKAAIEGSNCTHQHTADCYEKEACIHTHGEECSMTCSHVCSTDTGCITMQRECTHLAHDTECGGLDEENTVCNHICEVVVDSEGSCYALLCSHAEPDVHDEVCGYVETVAEKACEYICEECAMEEADAAAVEQVKALIDAIPALDVIQKMSQDEQKAIYEQTQVAYDAYEKLTKDQKSQISDANSFFEALFSYFNSLTSEVNTDSAFSGECGENLTWEFTNGVLTISGMGSMSDYSYDAPWYDFHSTLVSVVIKEGATSIGSDAFWGCDALESILIPSTVESIGNSAFSSCEKLTEITIPNSVKTIGRYAFSHCTLLEEISLSNQIEVISEYTFLGCANLRNLVLPSGLSVIGPSAFNSCSSLENVTIPDTVTTIGDDVFSSCESLTNFSIPDSVDSIGREVFRGCSSLEFVTMGNSVTSIGSDIFNGCTRLSSIELSDNLTHIPTRAFSGCGNLSSISIPDSVTSIANDVFANCSSLTNVTFGKGLESINKSAFVGCDNLLELWVSDDNPRYQSDQNGVLYNKNMDTVIRVPVGKQSVELPEGITGIGEYAFAYCTKLEKLTIPKTVITVGSEAYYACTSLLTAGPIGSGCNIEFGWETEIPAKAFHYAYELTEISLPSSITTIGASAFFHCWELKNIVLPDGLTKIGYSAFAECATLEHIEIPASVTTTGDSIFEGCKMLTSAGPIGSGSNIEFGWSDTIPSYAFSYADYLTSITLPEDLKEIRGHAFTNSGYFDNTSNWTGTVLYIGKWLIDGTDKPTDSIMGNGYTSGDCIIRNGTIGIADSAFRGCYGITSISMPEGLRYINNNAFYSCLGLSSISLPKSLVSIGDYAFYDCDGFTSVIIPDGTKRIGNGAFICGYDLKTITIPSSVTYIGSNAFNYGYLSDVFFDGSEERWEVLTGEEYDEDNSPYTLHYYGSDNGEGGNESEDDSDDSETETVKAHIQYFREWDSSNEIAFWGKDPPIVEGLDLGSQVTEETDRSFIASVNEMLGTYVLAATKSREDGMIAANILLNIKPIETKTGIVTAFDGTTITIDGAIYNVPDDLGLLFIDEGDTVIYHIYEGELIGINGDGSAEIEINKNSGEDSDSENSDEDASSSLTESVCYYSSWDPNKLIAYFGSFDTVGCQVTEETDTSFIDNVHDLIGTFVLVKRKTISNNQDEPDTLISITPLTSNVGKVSFADEAFLIIAEEKYNVDPNVLDLQNYVGYYVRYYIYNEVVVALERLTRKEGMLNFWNSESREVTIQSTGLGGSVIVYFLSSLADTESVSFLGTSGHKYSVGVVYYVDGNKQIYHVESAPPDFNSPEFDFEQSEEDIIQGYLLDYLHDFLKAYNEPKDGDTSFADEVCSALMENAEIDLDQIREDAINQRAQEMKAHDEDTNQNQFIAHSSYGEKYVDIAYKALATYFYDVTKNGIPDLSSIDITDTFAGADIINGLIENISTENAVYSIDGERVTLKISNMFGPDFGTIYVGSRLFVVSPREQDCRDALSALVTEMKDLASNAAYSMADSVYKEILGKSLTSLAGDYLGKTVENLGKKFDKPLEEVLQKAGLDNVLEVVNKSYSFYKNVEKTINTLTNDNVLEAIEQIENLKFKEIKINNWAVNQSKKAMNKAIDKMKEAFEWYLEGTLIEHEESFLNVIFGCPIEIAVYNAKGEQIGFVSDEECWYSDDLIIRRQGDIKKISMLVDDIPTFVITATDYGTMNCCIEECDDDYVPTGRMLFYDVALAPEKTFKLTVADDLKSNADNIALVSGGESIYADQFIPVDERTSVSVSCDLTNVEAGIVYGTGVYAHGDVALLRAVANEGYKFVGWYDGESLLDDGLTYEFITKDNRALTAKFAEISTVNVEVYNSAGGTTIGSGIHQKNTNVTLTAYANEGYIFDGWYYNNERQSNKTVYTFLADKDVVLEARFIEHVHSFKQPVFKWEDDYSCYTAFACENCNYGKYIDCSVISTTSPATESEDGETIYTATAEFGGQTYRDVKTVIIPSTGHTTHVAESQWSSDATNHWYKCTGCNEKLDVTTHSGGTATCTKKAICSVCGTSYGELAPHDYEVTWSQGNANGHWHECENCSTHDTQVKHTPGAEATEDTAQFCTVCGYVITPALGHTCTAGTKWYSNGTYHWHLCTSCGAWAKTSYHSYSSDTDETCNVCGYTRTVTATEPTQETEVAMTETTEATDPGEEVIATETAPMTVPTEANENLSDDAVSEDTDSRGVSGVLITVFAIVALGSLAVLVILLVYKKRRKSE